LKLLPCSSIALLLLAGCGGSSNPTPTVTPAPAEPPGPTVRLGDPLPDLNEDELAAFERGRELFSRRFKPSEGLGPLYNATSCDSCHSKPVPGGGSDLYRNFYVATFGITPTFQFDLPGLPSPVVPAFGTTNSPMFTLQGRRMDLPSSISGLPVTSAQRNGIPIFGTGLFEFISNETILSNADPDDLDEDGISGRTNSDGAGIGRLGVKAQSNNVELFTRAPLMNQMGITTDPFRGSAGTASLGHGAFAQASSSPNSPTRDFDGVADPELPAQDLADLIAFTRFLAPPEPKPFNTAALRGETLFGDIGCASCHIPELPSSRGPVRAYTDLLIHDMGPELADNLSFGRPQPSLIDPGHTGREFRSAPLWGVSHFGPWLHDGRAQTLEEAILMHGGEAMASRIAFKSLTRAERDDIITFLKHL
jgi:CxxC motif-containing protein (DUF1111 family)